MPPDYRHGGIKNITADSIVFGIISGSFLLFFLFSLIRYVVC